MRGRILITLCAALAVLGILAMPGKSSAGLNVSIGLYSPAPAFVLTGAPYLVVVPSTQVYYAPAMGWSLFFYQGYWYHPSEGRWYRSRHHNGPWRFVTPTRVPRPVHSVTRERGHRVSNHRAPSRNGWTTNRRRW